MENNYLTEFENFIKIIIALRTPVTGCPWDLEQTPLTLLPNLIEETYEVIEAVNSNDFEHIKEELGDLLLNTLMISYIHEQEKKFTISDVLKDISEKLVRRHPHVFGTVSVKDSAQVLENWDNIKENVEGKKGSSVLDGIPKSFAPLEYANKLQKKAAKVGFDWDSVSDIFKKIDEEICEIKQLLSVYNDNDKKVESPDLFKKLQGECGDLIFCAVNLCRKLNIDPAIALQMTNNKFKNRFSYIEEKMKQNELPLSKEEFKKMDELWEESKSIYS